MRGRYDGRTSYIIRGNPGCEDWCRRMVDISRIGKMWGLSEEQHHMGIMKHEEDFRQLTRRFGRYKKMRIVALKVIRGARVKERNPDEYVGWEEARAGVLQMRETAGYDSKVEESNFRERKGKGKSPDYYGKQPSAKGG